MKRSLNKIIIVTIVTLSIALGTGFPAFALSKEEVKITSDTAYMVEMNTNSVLYEKNADAKFYPASMTKIITAIVVMDNLSLDQEITIETLPQMGNESNMNLVEGETLTVEELLWGMLVVSANDACYVLAEEIAGGEAGFAELTNAKAEELGATNTNFVTSSGMHDDNHYSTAKDMSLIMAEAIQYDKIAEMLQTEEHTIEATNKSDERLLKNSNKLLSGSEDETYEVGDDEVSVKVPYKVMGKTGHVTSVGYNLINVAEMDGLKLLTVTVGAEEADLRTSDVLHLLEYGFSNFENVMLADSGETLERVKVERGSTLKVEGVAEKGVYATVNKELDEEGSFIVEPFDDVKAPVKEGQVIGRILTYSGDIQMGEIPLVAAKAIDVGGPWTAIGISDATFVLICIIITLLIIVRIICKVTGVSLIKRNRRRKKRKVSSRKSGRKKGRKETRTEKFNRHHGNYNDDSYPKQESRIGKSFVDKEFIIGKPYERVNSRIEKPFDNRKPRTETQHVRQEIKSEKSLEGRYSRSEKNRDLSKGRKKR